MEKIMSPKEIDYLDEMLQSGNLVVVEFIKADGSERTMRCTKDFSLIPVDQHPSEIIDAPAYNDLMKVFDVDAQAWRAFKPSRVTRWGPA